MNVSCFKSLICDNLLYQLHKTNRPSITQHILLELLFSCQVASHSLQPHGLQHARLPCPSLSPGVCPSSRVLNQWCHPTISSSDTLFSCPQPFPASVSFPMSQLFTSSGQSTRASASPSFLPMSIQGWLPLRLTGLLSFTIRLVKKFIRVFSIRCYRKTQMNFLAISMLGFHPYTYEGRRHIFKRKAEYRKVRILLYFWHKVWCSLHPGLSQRLYNSSEGYLSHSCQFSSKKTLSTGQMAVRESRETYPLPECSTSLYFYFNINCTFGIPQQERHNYKVW